MNTERDFGCSIFLPEEPRSRPARKAKAGAQVEWREDKQDLGWFIAPEGLQDFSRVSTLGTAHPADAAP